MAEEKRAVDFPQILAREVAKVIPWGVGLLLVIWIGYFTTLRPALGEIQGGMAAIGSLLVGRPIPDITRLSPGEIAAAKANIKAAIRFAQANAAEEIRRAATDPGVVSRVRRNVRRFLEVALEVGEARLRKATLENPGFVEKLKRNTRETLDFGAQRLAYHGPLAAAPGRTNEASLLREMRELREELARLRAELSKRPR